MDNIIAVKAQAVAKQADLSPPAAAINLGGIMAFITQLLQSLAICPTTPASVHGALSNPNARQQRIAKATARQHFRGDRAMQQLMLESMYEVGKVTTEQEAVEMYTAANGRPPG